VHFVGRQDVRATLSTDPCPRRPQIKRRRPFCRSMRMQIRGALISGGIHFLELVASDDIRATARVANRCLHNSVGRGGFLATTQAASNCDLGALPMTARATFGDCLHCGRAVPASEYFMLRDAVWRMVHDTNRGMMHLKCVEARLGRALRRPDFAARARINRMMSHLNQGLRKRYNPSTLELVEAHWTLWLCLQNTRTF